MRVGIDGRSLRGGARGIASYTRGLTTALAAGHPDDDWHVLVPGDGPSPTLPGVSVTRAPIPGRLLYGASAALRRPRLDALLGGVDVFWAPAPAPLAISRGTPLVLTVHDLSWERRPADFTRYERLWHRAARPAALANDAARVLTDSDPVAAEVIERWSLPAGRVAVVAPGVRAPAAEVDGERVVAVRARHGLPERYLLFVGALEPRKAPDLLARAYADARKAGLDAAVAFVGEGRLAHTLRGPGRYLLGRVEDGELDALYAGALALVMPSWLEGFGLPPLEAALRGTPSVLSDLPVFARTLGDAALLVRTGDEAALGVALRRIAENTTLRAELAARARARAAAFTWERAASEAHAVLAAAAAERT
jgi:glycosyltransferase involved in cell wall biosynthesis